MVTQQSWLFLRSFAGLRKKVLEHQTVATLAHLGEHAFDESAAAGAFVAPFTLRNAAPATEHYLAALRLIGPRSPIDKDVLLREALKQEDSVSPQHPVLSHVHQADLLTIPGTPFRLLAK
jgi:hypothetical protein